MLTKADRNTRVMVNTPTRVLFILDRTIFLERVCRGAGKSCPKGRGWVRRERERTEFSGDSASAIGELVEPAPPLASGQPHPRGLPEHPRRAQDSRLTACTPASSDNSTESTAGPSAWGACRRDRQDGSKEALLTPAERRKTHESAV